MKWILKAATQKALGSLPRDQDLNFFLQYHVTGSLPQGDAAFRRKLERAFQHHDTFAEHSSVPTEEAVFYEFGTGWDLAIPLAYAALGVPRQVLVDIRPNVRLRLVNDSIERFGRLRAELQAAHGHALRELGPGDVASCRELTDRFGLEYRAPADARATGLEAASVDFVSSTNTLEHVPAEHIPPILAECRRILRPAGVLSCRVDLRDHHSYFDSSVSEYAFLGHSDRVWRLVSSSLHFQNRLRRSDHLRMLDEAGFEVVAEQSARPSEADLARLRAMRLAPRFRGYALEDLGVKSIAVVARPRHGAA